MNREYITFKGIIPCVCIALTMLFFSGFFQAAEAALCPGSGPGISVAIIYCTRELINDALSGANTAGMLNMQPGSGGYLGQVINFLSPYKWAAITLALTLYGVKVVTLSVNEILKESASLLFRICIVLYLTASLNNSSFYHSGTGDGLYSALADAMGQLITWVNQGFSMVVPNCNPVIPTGANPDEYKVWGEFDCMFVTMFNTAAGPGGVVVGIIAMAGAAIFSAPVGVAILMMAITLFVQIFMTLCKAIYTLLLSYLVLALLCVIAPLLIPLLVFDNGFTRDVFWKWVGMVCSTIFQPLFMIGFLSFFVMVEDSFIDGPLPTCNSSYTSACSFKEILTNCGASATGNPCITDGPLFQLSYNIKWTPKCGCGSKYNPLNWPCIAWCKAVHIFSDIVNWAIHIAEKIVNSIIGMLIKVPKLIIGVIMKLFISFTAFVFITFILVELLEVIPHMAKEMTLSVGTAFFQLAQVPLQGVVANATKGLGDGMQAAAKQAASKGPGGMKGALQKVSGVTGAKNMASMPGIVGKGLANAGQSILRSVIK